MSVILFNTEWMLFNLYLAILPVLFSWFLFRMPNKSLTLLVGILWFVYLPNTVYVFTDLHHLIEQWSIVNSFEKYILVTQYAILEIIGLTCFLVAFYPLERVLNSLKLHGEKKIQILIAANMSIGLILSLGKFERVNSWDVFVNQPFLVTSVLHFLQTPEYIGVGLLFGLFANFFYFLFRSKIKKYYSQWAT